MNRPGGESPRRQGRRFKRRLGRPMRTTRTHGSHQTIRRAAGLRPQVADAIAGGRLLRSPVPGGFRAAAGFAIAAPGRRHWLAHPRRGTGAPDRPRPGGGSVLLQPTRAAVVRLGVGVGRAVRARLPLARAGSGGGDGGVGAGTGGGGGVRPHAPPGRGIVDLRWPAPLAAASASSIHYLARPHVFSILLYAVALGIVEEDGRHPGWRVWTLVPLAALWANLHAGFAMLPATLGAGGRVRGPRAGACGTRCWQRPRGRPRCSTPTAGGCTNTSFAT